MVPCEKIHPVTHFLPVTIVKKIKTNCHIISEYCRGILITERSSIYMYHHPFKQLRWIDLTPFSVQAQAFLAVTCIQYNNSNITIK